VSDRSATAALISRTSWRLFAPTTRVQLPERGRIRFDGDHFGVRVARQEERTDMPMFARQSTARGRERDKVKS
jgi:hypothetical protein